MADETKTILAIVVSLIAAVAGAVLFFVSIAKTSKGNLNIKTPSVTSSAGALAPRTCPYVTKGVFVFLGGAYGRRCRIVRRWALIVKPFRIRLSGDGSVLGLC